VDISEPDMVWINTGFKSQLSSTYESEQMDHVNMEAVLKNWTEKFDAEVSNIEIKFNAYLTRGKITDYFKLEVNEGILLIYFNDTFDLPEHIKRDLIEALQRTRPAELK